eukprot:10216508-Karenia_brevis.AAC.1
MDKDIGMDMGMDLDLDPPMILFSPIHDHILMEGWRDGWMDGRMDEPMYRTITKAPPTLARTHHPKT